MVNKINGDKNPKYNKVIMHNPKTNEKKTYLIPVGRNLVIGRGTFELDKVKNGELTIKGGDTKDSRVRLVGLVLEHLDVNKDGKIDEKDSDYKIAEKMNEKALKGTKYYVKTNDIFTDAGIEKGLGGVVLSEDGKGQIFGVEIEESKKEK